MAPPSASGRFVLLLALAGCSTPGLEVRRAVSRGDVPAALERYREYRRERGAGDPDVLAEVALGLLSSTAASAEAHPRASGFSALRSLGVRGRDTLEALAQRPGVVGERALVALWELDGRSGRVPASVAPAVTSDDPERRALGAVYLASRRDRVGLLRMLEDPDGSVRAAAVRELARGADASAQGPLEDHARRDPSALVRAAAVVALGGYGPSAAETLTAALTDPDRMVRMVSPASLAAAAPTLAEARLGPLLTPEPGELSLEAARALCTRHVARAEDYLLAALSSPQPGVRAQAAVAVTLVARDRAAELARHLEHPDPEVALRVAAMLVRRPDLRARSLVALRHLAARPEGFVAIRALAALASEGQEHTLEPVTEALGSPQAAVRRLAVLAWPDVVTVSDDVDPLAPLLLDPDPSVALLAAVEIVLIAAR